MREDSGAEEYKKLITIIYAKRYTKTWHTYIKKD